MKKIIFLISFCVILLALCFSVSAEDIMTSGDYYLVQDSNIFSIIYVYQSEIDYIADLDDGNYDDFLIILYTSEFQEDLNEIYDEYKNLPVIDEETGYTGYDSFTDYLHNYNSSFYSNSRLMEDMSEYLEYIEERESSEDGEEDNGEDGEEGGAAGGEGSGDEDEGGGSSGDSGGDSSEGGGSSGGATGTGPSPTIPNIDYSEGRWDDVAADEKCNNCKGLVSPNATGSNICDCWREGYMDGWDNAFHSDLFYQLMQMAYDEGFEYSNSDSWSDLLDEVFNNATEAYKNSDEQRELIAAKMMEAIEEYLQSEEYRETLENERTEAVEEYKSSEEYNNTLNNERIEAVEEYKESPEYNEALSNAADEAVDDFKESPEQIAIIEEAKEGAVADFTVRMEGILNGTSSPDDDVTSSLNSAVESKIEAAQSTAVNNFVESMQSILSGGGVPGEGTPEEQLNNSINESLNASFDAGAEYGKADYKLSAEYKNSLKSEYNAGAEAGYQSGYEVGTNDGYVDGLIDGAEFANEELYVKGVNEYKTTQEYKDILQNTFNDGYNQGADEASSPDFSVLIVPIVVLSCIILFSSTLSLALNRRNKKR